MVFIRFARPSRFFTHLFLFVLIFYIECETEGVYPQGDGGPAMAFDD